MPDQLSRGVDMSSPGRAPDGGADCVILADAGAGRSGIEILQVIESLSYRRDDHVVEILLDIISHNRGDKPAQYRAVHRGGVTARLARFPSAGTGDCRQIILRELYGDRIIDKDEHTILFQPRLNCCAIEDKHLDISLDGPGQCLQGVADSIPLVPEIGGDQPGAAFTSYLLPPPDSGKAIAPGEFAVCRLEITVPPVTYGRLVENRDWFSVDSYGRLIRDIVSFDLPEVDQAYSTFCEEHLARSDVVLPPVAYDIVVFQTAETRGYPVKVESSSMCIERVYPGDPEVAKRLEHQVLWFFGHKHEFHLRLHFSERSSGSVSSGRSASTVLT